MPYSQMPTFEIKMLNQERIHGPLSRAVATAGSAVKFDFFFTFAPYPNQQVTQKPTVVVPQKG